MDSSDNTLKGMTTADYDSEPVFYCKNCLSLNIMYLDGMDYCDECGCTDIESTDIYTWEKIYERKYGKPFNERKH